MSVDGASGGVCGGDSIAVAHSAQFVGNERNGAAAPEAAGCANDRIGSDAEIRAAAPPFVGWIDLRGIAV